jgi:general secretion pathway protein A
LEYYELLGLDREPFADTANPYFLYASPDHDDCLSRLEIAIRLGRGLALVLGDVGTGKTTMALALEQSLRADERFFVGAIYDPAFFSEDDLIEHVFLALGVEVAEGATMPQRLDGFRDFLVRKADTDNQSVVLILDESQKLSPQNLELLRLLLNNQRPDRRLFNVVMFGQLELLPAIEQNVALKDRINLLYVIRPLSRQQTHELIDFRVRQAGGDADSPLFGAAAKDKIFEASAGHPRKIVLLCQEAIQESFAHDKSQIDAPVVDAVLTRRSEVESFIASYMSKQVGQARIFDTREHAYVSLPSASLAPAPPPHEALPSASLVGAQAAEKPTLSEVGAASGAAVVTGAAVVAEAGARSDTSADASSTPSAEPPGLHTPASPLSEPTPQAQVGAAEVSVAATASAIPSAPPLTPPARRSFWQWLFGG